MISLYSAREKQEAEQRNKWQWEVDSFLRKHFKESAVLDLHNEEQQQKTSEAVISGYSSRFQCKGQSTRPGAATTNTDHVEGRGNTGPPEPGSLRADTVSSCHWVTEGSCGLLPRENEWSSPHPHMEYWLALQGFSLYFCFSFFIPCQSQIHSRRCRQFIESWWSKHMRHFMCTTVVKTQNLNAKVDKILVSINMSLSMTAALNPGTPF